METFVWVGVGSLVFYLLWGFFVIEGEESWDRKRAGGYWS